MDLGDPKPVLLHTEVMSDHLLVAPDLELSGLVDFEPAMRGAAEYEFVATGVFLTRGDLEAHEALLHVYSNLPRCLREIPPGEAKMLDSLADLWFGTPGM